MPDTSAFKRPTLTITSTQIKPPLLLTALLLGAGASAFVFWQGVTSPAGRAAQGSVSALPRVLHPQLVAGLDAMRRGDLATARERFRQVPANDPAYLIALDNLVTVEEHLAGPHSVVSLLEGLAAQQPQNPEIYLRLGRAYYRAGRYSEALQAAARAFQLDPSSSPASYDLGLFFLAAGDLPRSIDAYLRAIQQDRESFHVAEALAALRRHHESRPADPDPHFPLALFYQSLGWPEQELNELERYLAMNPQGPAVEVARQRLAAARRASDRD